MKMLVRDESRSRREEEAEEQIGLSGQALPSMTEAKGTLGIRILT